VHISLLLLMVEPEHASASVPPDLFEQADWQNRFPDRMACLAMRELRSQIETKATPDAAKISVYLKNLAARTPR
jgi:hypothetical protein